MSRTVGAIILVIVVVGSVGGYLYVQNMADAYKEITFTLNSIDSEVITQDRFKLICSLTLDNPSNYELIIPEIDFQVSIDGLPLSDGILPKTTLEPNQETQITIELELSLDDLQTTALSSLYKKFILGEPSEINIRGTIKAKPLIQTIELPFNKQIMDLEKPKLTIETNPIPSNKDDIVTITVTDPQGSPVEGSGIYMIPIIQSVLSDNVIENGEHIGTTDQNGELSYQFTEPDLYALLATKPLQYRAALTEHRVRILNDGLLPNPDLGIDLPNITLPDIDNPGITIPDIDVPDIITPEPPTGNLTITLTTPNEEAEINRAFTVLQARVTQDGSPAPESNVGFMFNGHHVGTVQTGPLGYANIPISFEPGTHTWSAITSQNGVPIETEPRTLTYTVPTAEITPISPISNPTLADHLVVFEMEVDVDTALLSDVNVQYFMDDVWIGSSGVGMLGKSECDYWASVGEHTWYAEVYVDGNFAGRSTTESFTIVEPFDFTLDVTPSSGSVSKGDSIEFTITVTHIQGTAEAVSLSASGMPSSTKTFSKLNGTPTYTSTLTVNTNMLTTKTTHTIEVTAVSESQEYRIFITIQVT